ncbi:MAG: AgmX/PglI C-terminal domain-containing protein [Nannocystaceae bacterium]
MVPRRRFPLAIALCSLLACRRDDTAAVDPCAGGACAPAPDCELGSCMGDAPTLVSQHSPIAGTEIEAGATCPYVDGVLPPRESVLDDKHIPEFKQGRSRRTNMDSGEATPQDIQLHEQLMGVQGRIFECLDLAACYDQSMDPFTAGELDFKFELEPNGRVSAVTVVPSPELADPLVKACARRSLFEHRFPSYSGARMTVSYRIEIGEG